MLFKKNYQLLDYKNQMAINIQLKNSSLIINRILFSLEFLVEFFIMN